MVLKLLKSRLIPVDISGLDTARNLNTFFMFSSSSWSRIPFENTSIYHIKDTCMGFYLNTYTTIYLWIGKEPWGEWWWCLERGDKTSTLESEIHPTEKGSTTSLSILSLIFYQAFPFTLLIFILRIYTMKMITHQMF